MQKKGVCCALGMAMALMTFATLTRTQLNIQIMDEGI